MRVEFKRVEARWLVNASDRWILHALEAWGPTGRTDDIGDVQGTVEALGMAPVREGAALAVRGGATAHASFQAFIAAMAILVGSEADPHDDVVERTIRVEAETTIAMARCMLAVSQRSAAGGNDLVRGPLSAGPRLHRGHVAAIQYATAWLRPIVDPRARPYATLGEVPEEEVATATIPTPGGSASLRAARALARGRAIGEAVAHLHSIGAPAAILQGVTEAPEPKA